MPVRQHRPPPALFHQHARRLCLLTAVWASVTVGACGDGRSIPTSPGEQASPSAGLTPPSVISALTIDFASVASYAAILPAHYDSTVTKLDNSPGGADTNDRVATLGRVLFYDKKLSVNDTTSCATCHQQASGFSEPTRFSTGFSGGRTTAHSPRLGRRRHPSPS